MGADTSGNGKSGETQAGKAPKGDGRSASHGPRPKILSQIPVLKALLRGGEWTRSDTLTAIGVVVAMLAIIVPTLASVFTGTSEPNLKVDDVEIALASSINASDDVLFAAAPKPDRDTGSAVDITLRNTGDEPALVVKAVLSFVRVSELASCPGGAGGLVSSADYDVRVPINRTATASDPLVLVRNMRFVVKPNSLDRLRISVGPTRYEDTEWPWIYEFKLSLVEDNGRSLDLGPMSTLGFSKSSRIPRSWDPLAGIGQNQLVATGLIDCVTRDAASLSRAMETPGLHSPELQAMYREAERLTTF